jgi:hypothetical protein
MSSPWSRRKQVFWLVCCAVAGFCVGQFDLLGRTFH